MALSKAAKAALIAGGLYGLYRMLGKDQDGSKVPVEDRNTIRKTIAAADKKEDKKSASSARNEQAGLAAAAPSVKDKPTVKPATPETPAAGAVKRASMAERKRGTAKQRARQDVMGTARLIDQGGRNAAAAASRAARKKESGLARAGLAMGKAAREATAEGNAAKVLNLMPTIGAVRGAMPMASRAIQSIKQLGSSAKAPQLAAPTRRLTGPTSGARDPKYRRMKDIAIDEANAKREALDAARAARAATRQEQMVAENARRMGLDPTRRTIASDAVRAQMRQRNSPDDRAFSIPGAKSGGSQKYSSGKSVTKGRGDGMAQRGKTKGRMC
jgi:hypothetical protein